METIFSAVSNAFKGALGRNFVLVFLFPIVIFVGLSSFLALEITYGMSATLAAWEKLSLQTQGLLLVGIFIILTFISFLLYHFQYAITRLFEGYWVKLPLQRSRRAYYKRLVDYLDLAFATATSTASAEAIVAERLTFFPPPNHVDLIMPTLIGNVLRSTETYPYDRYGIDSTVLWTRLYPLLKAEAVDVLEEKKIGMDFMLLMTALTAGFSFIWCPILALFTNRWDLFLWCSLGIPVTWLFYQNAVSNALAYSDQLKATFDLYRQELLKMLNRPVSSNAGEERREWLRLSRFYYRNLPLPPATPTADRGWNRVADALADYLEKINSSQAQGNQGEK